MRSDCLSDLRALARAMRRAASLAPFAALVATRALTYATPPQPLLAPGWHDTANFAGRVRCGLADPAGIAPERREELGSSDPLENQALLVDLVTAVSRPGLSGGRCLAPRGAPAGPLLASPERQPRAPPSRSDYVG